MNLCISPRGWLFAETAPDSNEGAAKRIIEAFADSSSRGILHLSTTELQASLPADFSSRGETRFGKTIGDLAPGARSSSPKSTMAKAGHSFLPYTRDSRTGRVPAGFPANGRRFGCNGSVGSPNARFGVPKCRLAEGVVGGP